MGRQRMPISDEEKAIILVLHLSEGTYRTEVIPQMEVTRGAYPADYCIHFYLAVYIIYPRENYGYIVSLVGYEDRK